MANVTLWGASYSDVPSIEVPKTGGGMAAFIDEDEIVTYYVSQSNPTSSQGEDGDIWLVTS